MVGGSNIFETDVSKNAAYIPPAFGSPMADVPGSGERLTPNLRDRAVIWKAGTASREAVLALLRFCRLPAENALDQRHGLEQRLYRCDQQPVLQRRFPRHALRACPLD